MTDAGELLDGDAAAGAPSGWARGQSDPLMDALQVVLRVAALARPAMAKQLGLSLTEIWAVEHLVAEPMGPVELSRRLDITSAASTVLARRLEDAGHLAREPHPDDRRRTVLRPTPQAMGRLWGVLSPLLERLEAAGADLSDSERDVVLGYLLRVAEALDDGAAVS